MALVVPLDVLFLIFLGIVGFLVLRGMTPQERERAFKQVVPVVRQFIAVIRRRNPDWDAFRDRLRSRTRFAIVTPILIAINIIVFVMAHGQGTTLLDWGASFGPRTTNGEWWRVITSLFVHGTLMHLVVNAAALATVGVVLERYVGPAAFAGVYLAAGVAGALMNLHWYPVAVTGGASGPIFGLYGLFVACCFWALRTDAGDETIRVPVAGLVRLAPAAGVFALYSLLFDGLAFAAEFVTVAIGLGAGLFLAKRVSDAKPTPAQAGLVAFAASVLAVVMGVPLRGMANVKPAIEQVIAVEEKTAADYESAYDRFKKGRLTAQGLVDAIDKRIMPQLEDVDRRLKALTRVPAEQQPIVANATEYLELRTQSWRFRADALRKAGAVPTRADKYGDAPTDTAWRMRADAQYRATTATFGKAESAERASLDAFRRLKSAASE